ncbi:MAG: FHA domain-containing protein [Planctomycetes bacterium]|nr:FHA domain-containing protein [Planctomycetota bacterium]
MRLFVSLGTSSVNELKFDRGPVYVGRQMGSQVFLPDKAVSRQHAVFYTTKDGDWIIEDLGSANKTYLNDQAVHRAELKHNDIICIADFTIRVSLEEDEDQQRRMNLEDTLVGEGRIRRELHTVDRKIDAADAPPIRFPAHRMHHLHDAVKTLGGQKTFDVFYKSLMDVLFRQFSALNIWLSLRHDPSGPAEIQGGRKISTEHIERIDLAVPKSLSEAIEKNLYLLIHQLPRQISARGIRSVMICPVMLQENNYGIIYIENSTEHPHYSLQDLDYLMVLSVFAAYLVSKMK